jgi:hypothetical protein
MQTTDRVEAAFHALVARRSGEGGGGRPTAYALNQVLGRGKAESTSFGKQNPIFTTVGSKEVVLRAGLEPEAEKGHERGGAG